MGLGVQNTPHSTCMALTTSLSMPSPFGTLHSVNYRMSCQSSLAATPVRLPPPSQLMPLPVLRYIGFVWFSLRWYLHAPNNPPFPGWHAFTDRTFALTKLRNRYNEYRREVEAGGTAREPRVAPRVRPAVARVRGDGARGGPDLGQGSTRQD